jgi:ribonuclease-3
MRALLAIAGAKATDIDAFDTAFVHESAVSESLAAYSNERLEFLGDALLGAAVARSLYDRYPDAPEGELALRKSALVSDLALAATAERLGFDALLITGSALANQPPERRRSLLADAFEAFIATLAKQSGDAVANAFISREHISVREIELPLEDDPKTVLQEWAQRRFKTTPVYVDRFDGPDHARTFVATIEIDGARAEGTGPSKKTSQREAAANMLAILRERYDDIAPRTFSQPKAQAEASRAPSVPNVKPPERRVRVWAKKKSRA